MANVITCEHCEAGIEIPPEYDKPFAYCPQCQKMAKTGLTEVLETEAPEELPEIMKANRRLAGRICPVCLQAIQLGVPVHNCLSCREPSHQDCWNLRQGCGNPSCGKTPAATPLKSPDRPTDESPIPFEQPPLPVMDSPSDLSPTRSIPCRWCREPIPWNACRCPVCQEMQRDSDRPIAIQARAAAAEIPGINRFWGIGIMLFSLMAILGFIISGIIAMGEGHIESGATTLIPAVIFYMVFRSGQGMYCGERSAIYLFGVFSVVAFLFGLFITSLFSPLGIVYFPAFGVFFAPPLISAFIHWGKFHA